MNKIKVKTDIIIHNKHINDITLIHISDIHFNKYTKVQKLIKIKEEIYKNNPDYILITGDTIDEPSIIKDKVNLKKLLVFLTDISANSKVLISLGNHDTFMKDDSKFFKKLNDFPNIYILDNTCYVDESIYISGFTLPNKYYYNITRKESKELLIEHLNKYKKLTNNLPVFIPKVSLIHSPIKLPEKEILTILREYDLLLSGHTHGGLVPNIINKLLKPNQGIIAPNHKLFPEIARGRIEKNINNKKINIIINSGITKLGEKSAKALSKFNFLFDIDINKIIITNKKGRYYE